MRTSFNIPDDLLAKFDETWQAEELDSRSRGVREAMQEYIEAHSRLEDIEGDVVVIVSFDYEHEAVIEDIHEGEWCLETLFCSGPAPHVRDLTYRLRDFDAVSRVKLMLLVEQ
jgi:CopG family nickel-responsive transcriptional regulator